MTLLIDTSDNETMTIALARRDGSLAAHKKIKSHFQRSEKLLPMLDTLLRTRKKTISSVHGVAVVSGPGGFTSLRVGIATANALAYALGVPVVGLRRQQFSDQANFARQVAALLRKKRFATGVVPVYGREPNITTPKA